MCRQFCLLSFIFSFDFRFLWLNGIGEFFDFFGVEFAVGADGEFVVADVSDGEAFEFDDGMSDGVEHFADLLVVSFVERYFIPAVAFGRFEDFYFTRRGFEAVFEDGAAS